MEVWKFRITSQQLRTKQRLDHTFIWDSFLRLLNKDYLQKCQQDWGNQQAILSHPQTNNSSKTILLVDASTGNGITRILFWAGALKEGLPDRSYRQNRISVKTVRLWRKSRRINYPKSSFLPHSDLLWITSTGQTPLGTSVPGGWGRHSIKKNLMVPHSRVMRWSTGWGEKRIANRMPSARSDLPK